MSYLGFCEKWAKGLAEINNLNQEEQNVLAFVIEVLFLNILNAVLTLTIGWVLGVFGNTAVCLLTIAAFRHNAGGGHSNSPWRCALVTMVVFPSLALAARFLSLYPYLYLDLLSFAAFTIGFTFISIYAPVDNPKAPIISAKRRKKLKILAFSVLAAIAMIVLSLRFSSWVYAAEIRMCLVLSLLWISFNLTPLGHHLWRFIDGKDT
jgi:accessory gene regulator B